MLEFRLSLEVPQRLYVDWYVGTMVLKFCTIDIAQITFGLVGNHAISPWLFLRNSEIADYRKLAISKI